MLFVCLLLLSFSGFILDLRHDDYEKRKPGVCLHVRCTQSKSKQHLRCARELRRQPSKLNRAPRTDSWTSDTTASSVVSLAEQSRATKSRRDVRNTRDNAGSADWNVGYASCCCLASPLCTPTPQTSPCNVSSDIVKRRKTNNNKAHARTNNRTRSPCTLYERSQSVALA